MKLRATVFRCAILSTALVSAAGAVAAVVESSWDIALPSGEWAADGNWSKAGWPSAADTAAGFYGKAGESVVTVVRLPDETNRINHLHVIPRAPSVFTFDGRGRTFSMGALEEGAFRRGLNTDGGSFYPFRIMSETSSNAQALELSRTSNSGHLEPVFDWRDVLFRVSAMRTKQVEAAFLDGVFDFDVDRGATWNFAYAPVAVDRVDLLVSNATVKCAAVSTSLGATNSSLTVAQGGLLELHGSFAHGHNVDFAYPGTNAVTVKDGGRLVFDDGAAGRNSLAFRSGTAKNAVRRHEIVVTGDGSAADFSRLSTVNFSGNTSFSVSDGAQVVLSGLTTLGAYAADAFDTSVTEMTVSGDDTAVYISTNIVAGSAVTGGSLSVGSGACTSNRLTMTGGRIRPVDPAGSAPVALYVGNGPATDAVFEMRGGDVDLWVTNNVNPSVNCMLKIGPGDALVHVSGGRIFCGDLYVGANQPGNVAEGTVAHDQELCLTGGEVVCNRLYLGTSGDNATYRYQNARVTLDGGVLCTRTAYVNKPLYAGGMYTGTLTADGGTVRARSDSNDLVNGFETASLGPEGLTLDTAGFTALTLSQSFSDKSGEKGCLRVTGGGTITFTPDRYHTVSTTCVEQATTLLMKTNTLLQTTLVLDGGTVSLQSAADALAVDGFEGRNGTLLLDPGDTVHLRTSAIRIDRMTVKFTSSPAADDPVGVFSFDGDVTADAGVRAALRRLRLYGEPAGLYGAFAMTYDAAGGRTVVSMTMIPESEPLDASAATVWTGPAWSAEGWSAGVPDGERLALFSDASAPAAVTVPPGASAGALSFTSGTSNTFTGAELDVSGLKGAAFVSVASGKQTFDNPLAFWYTVPLQVDAGAVLAFNGPLRDGGIAKTGNGRLELAAENAFLLPVSFGGGVTAALSPGALGVSGAEAYLADGTLVFSNALDGTEMTVPTPVVLASSATPTNALIVKTDTDVVFPGFSVSAGALIKRGRGRMTIEIPGDSAPTLYGGYGVGAGPNYNVLDNVAAIDFPADGSAPDPALGQYTGFNVAEGEVVLRGTAGGPTVLLKTALSVGLYYAGDPGTASQPVLTVDGVDLSHNSGGGHWRVGHLVAKPGGAVCRPLLRVVNGGKVRCGNLRVGDASNYAGAFSTVAATNATVLAANALRFYTGGGTPATQCVFLRFKDSTAAVTGTGGSNHGIQLGGNIEGDFDNSFFGGSNEPGILNMQGTTCGELRFRNGSVFSVNRMNQTAYDANLVFTLAFDDAEWRWGGGDYTLSYLESGTGAGLRRTRRIEMRGTGAVLKPAAGETFTTGVTFEGDGGLVCAGPGTVKFLGAAYGFAGLLDIRAGTVDLTASDPLAAVTAKGPGTLKGGTVASLTLKAAGPADASPCAPVLDGVAADVVTVDFGAAADDPLALEDCRDLLVATYPAGAAPSVGRWKVSGTGHEHADGLFTVKDGAVRVRLVQAIPLQIFVR